MEQTLPEGFGKITEGKATVIFRKFSNDNKEEVEKIEEIKNKEDTKNNKQKRVKKNEPKNSEQEVFYNPAMETNRDLSIAVSQVFVKLLKEENETKKRKRLAKEDLPLKDDKREGIRILEALSATGLRSIRYAKEVEGVHSIVANDIEPSAIEAIKRNIQFNGLATSLDQVDENSPFPPIIPNLQDAVFVFLFVFIN